MSRVVSTELPRGRRTRRDVVVTALGAVYLALAVTGIVAVGTGGFDIDRPVLMFGIFGASSLANILHGVLGVLLVVAGVRRTLFAFAPVALVVFTAMMAFGIVTTIFQSGGDFPYFTWWNVLLYLVSAAVCVFAYAFGVRSGSKQGNLAPITMPLDG